ncbi:hypothetical protein [Bartonella phoceensis]|uniref:hypothetical protein n=1 Tax=Bartonella phoceensis TaxID=270249 RepID=UPI001ABAD0BD|nr:hypothetical protein [Bartonella phoceensis]
MKKVIILLINRRHAKEAATLKNILAAAQEKDGAGLCIILGLKIVVFNGFCMKSIHGEIFLICGKSTRGGICAFENDNCWGV